MKCFSSKEKWTKLISESIQEIAKEKEVDKTKDGKMTSRK